MDVTGHPECNSRGASVSTVCSGEGGESHLPETHSDAAQRGTTGFAEEGSAYLKNQDGKDAGNLCSSVVKPLCSKRYQEDEESGAVGRTLRRGGKRQRDLIEGLVWVCFNERLINYGWQRGERSKLRQRKRVRMKKHQSSINRCED